MSGIVSSVGGIVEAGVKGLLDLAEGYINPNSSPDPATGSSTLPSSASLTAAESISIPSQPAPADSSTASRSSVSTVSTVSTVSSVAAATNLIQVTDVPSGWIHLQSTYLDEAGSQRKIRSFGVKNLVDREVEVVVKSDLRGQLTFWMSEDDRVSSASSSTTSSSLNSAGTSSLTFRLSPLSAHTVHLAFSASADLEESILTEDGGFTPRLLPVPSPPNSADVSPLVPQRDEWASSEGSVSGRSDHSVTGSSYKSSSTSGHGHGTLKRGAEPVHRASSVHGSITVSASTPDSLSAAQTVTLPFFATVCKSLFTASLIDPTTGLATGSQSSSGQLAIDFGSENIVGTDYHRDILLVNRSEIELVWNTSVVNSRWKDSVWFSLRDLDSENVFGVDRSAAPMPLPALSSRHLRLELRVKEPVVDFDFDFVIANQHKSGNIVSFHATGGGLAESADTSLKILSGTTLDFGQIHDGAWAKKLVTLKNAGERPLDIKLSASSGFDVVFRLAGVAGDDLEDEALEIGSKDKAAPAPAPIAQAHDALSRHSTRDNRAPVPPRGESPASSFGGRSYLDPSALSHHTSNSSHPEDDARSSHGATSDRGRAPSQPPSRPLSRVASRASSYRWHTDATSSDEEDEGEHEHYPPFFSPPPQSASTAPTSEVGGSPNQVVERTSQAAEMPTLERIQNQIEELAMRPGTEYRIYILYRPTIQDASSPTAGNLRPSSWKVYVDSSSSSKSKSRRTIHCSAESCTSLIGITSGQKIDFGEVTVGASTSTNITIANLSALSARVEIAAISKVLSANRSVIVIPPLERVTEKLEFFPRRINDRYEKQIFVRNLLNRKNDQLVDIRAKNVDVYNLTLHSHLYRILTPSGSNYLDFGSVVINSPSVRSIQFENLTFAPLVLALMASQPEDIECFIKLEDAPKVSPSGPRIRSREDEAEERRARVSSPPNGELKERFMESLREIEGKTAAAKEASTSNGQLNGDIKAKAKTAIGEGKKKSRKSSISGGLSGGLKDASTGLPVEGDEAQPKKKGSVGATVMAALKKGGRGRPVQLYGNAVVFKDRTLLEPHEYLDLASGPPVAAHRTSPRSKRTILLDSIEQGDRSKLSGQHPRIPKLDFAASAKATGLLSKLAPGGDGPRGKKSAPPPPSTQTSASSDPFSTATSTTTPSVMSPSPSTSPVAAPPLSLAAVVASIASADLSSPSGTTGGSTSGKSPALTGKRSETRSATSTEMYTASDISKMSVDELLLALEAHDARKSGASHLSLQDEETYVRTTLSLRKELSNLVSTGKLVPARSISIPPKGTLSCVVIMTPNGSIRPHITTRPKRADSRVFIRLLEFDKSLLSRPMGKALHEVDLPVRDLIIRSSCVRSVLEVQQSSINFGGTEKGEVKSKTIVIQNKSDTIGLFRLRTSGSIASGDLKLGLGRYGVIPAFGRKEVANFSFTPSLVGNYQETISVENVLDSSNDQAVSVKANVRKQPNFSVEPATLDFGEVATSECSARAEFKLTNVSKIERTFIVTIAPREGSSSSTSSSPDNATAASTADTSAGASGNGSSSGRGEGASGPEWSLSRDEGDAGTALSQAEEEEAEGLLQKLKIARRKGKADKIKKYETRLTELGVIFPCATEGADAGGEGAEGIEGDDEPESSSTTTTSPTTPSKLSSLSSLAPLAPLAGLSTPAAGLATQPQLATLAPSPRKRSTTLTITLAPNQKTKIVVDLVRAGVGSGAVEGSIRVHERKNTDEVIVVGLLARRAGQSDKGVSVPPLSSGASPESLQLGLMRHCLDLSLQCIPSPTAFCVGSTLFLPSSSAMFAQLQPHFPAFATQDGKFVLHPASSTPRSAPVTGLILGDGYSRQIPGNTHAEANALTNFRSFYSSLLSSDPSLPPAEDVLHESECYATMEPCSIRTSGGPSCALELVRAKVHKVYLGVEEPADFVICEGEKILQDGGVEVVRLKGLEKECLDAARRGR